MKFFVVNTSNISLRSNYNIFPGKKLTVILEEEGVRKITGFKWGFLPFWTKKVEKGMINVRSETVMQKPTFRHSYNKRRCLIPASGFYEWKREAESQQPFFFSSKNKEIFGFAGIWNQWCSPEGEKIHTCAILTCEANSLIKPIHQRMPVIIHEKQFGVWLGKEKPIKLMKLLKPYSSEKMQVWKVSTEINRPDFNRSECLDPI